MPLKLSKTSKMPCPSFALPAGDKCKTGRKLMTIIGSVCRSCYARKGMSMFPNSVKLRNENYRLTMRALWSNQERDKWIETLVGLIHSSSTAWFRWHDSGDVQSVWHLKMIAEVCRRTPKVRHWMPTREHGFVKRFAHFYEVPPNLTIRQSAHMVGDVLTGKGLLTSSVGAAAGHMCPATYKKEIHGRECGDCRACWSKNIKQIDYKRH